VNISVQNGMGRLGSHREREVGRETGGREGIKGRWTRLSGMGWTKGKYPEFRGGKGFKTVSKYLQPSQGIGVAMHSLAGETKEN